MVNKWQDKKERYQVICKYSLVFFYKLNHFYFFKWKTTLYTKCTELKKCCLIGFDNNTLSCNPPQTRYNIFTTFQSTTALPPPMPAIIPFWSVSPLMFCLFLDFRQMGYTLVDGFLHSGCFRDLSVLRNDQQFITVYCWVAFHHRDIPFVYTFTYWWMDMWVVSSLFLVFAIINKIAIEHLYKSLHVDICFHFS